MYVRVLHQPVWSDDARGEDSAARLGRAVGGAHDGEDDGACAPERSKEGLSDGDILQVREWTFKKLGEAGSLQPGNTNGIDGAVEKEGGSPLVGGGRKRHAGPGERGGLGWVSLPSIHVDDVHPV